MSSYLNAAEISKQTSKELTQKVSLREIAPLILCSLFCTYLLNLLLFTDSSILPTKQREPSSFKTPNNANDGRKSENVKPTETQDYSAASAEAKESSRPSQDQNETPYISPKSPTSEIGTQVEKIEPQFPVNIQPERYPRVVQVPTSKIPRRNSRASKSASVLAKPSNIMNSCVDKESDNKDLMKPTSSKRALTEIKPSFTSKLPRKNSRVSKSTPTLDKAGNTKQSNICIDFDNKWAGKPVPSNQLLTKKTETAEPKSETKAVEPNATSSTLSAGGRRQISPTRLKTGARTMTVNPDGETRSQHDKMCQKECKGSSSPRNASQNESKKTAKETESSGEEKREVIEEQHSQKFVTDNSTAALIWSQPSCDGQRISKETMETAISNQSESRQLFEIFRSISSLKSDAEKDDELRVILNESSCHGKKNNEIKHCWQEDSVKETVLKIDSLSDSLSDLNHVMSNLKISASEKGKDKKDIAKEIVMPKKTKANTSSGKTLHWDPGPQQQRKQPSQPSANNQSSNDKNSKNCSISNENGKQGPFDKRASLTEKKQGKRDMVTENKTPVGRSGTCYTKQGILPISSEIIENDKTQKQRILSPDRNGNAHSQNLPKRGENLIKSRMVVDRIEDEDSDRSCSSHNDEYLGRLSTETRHFSKPHRRLYPYDQTIEKPHGDKNVATKTDVHNTDVRNESFQNSKDRVVTIRNSGRYDVVCKSLNEEGKHESKEITRYDKTIENDKAQKQRIHSTDRNRNAHSKNLPKRGEKLIKSRVIIDKMEDEHPDRSGSSHNDESLGKLSIETRHISKPRRHLYPDDQSIEKPYGDKNIATKTEVYKIDLRKESFQNSKDRVVSKCNSERNDVVCKGFDEVRKQESEENNRYDETPKKKQKSVVSTIIKSKNSVDSEKKLGNSETLCATTVQFTDNLKDSILPERHQRQTRTNTSASQSEDSRSKFGSRRDSSNKLDDPALNGPDTAFRTVTSNNDGNGSQREGGNDSLSENINYGLHNNHKTPSKYDDLKPMYETLAKKSTTGSLTDQLQKQAITKSMMDQLPKQAITRSLTDQVARQSCNRVRSTASSNMPSGSRSKRIGILQQSRLLEREQQKLEMDPVNSQLVKENLLLKSTKRKSEQTISNLNDELCILKEELQKQADLNAKLRQEMKQLEVKGITLESERSVFSELLITMKKKMDEIEKTNIEWKVRYEEAEKGKSEFTNTIESMKHKIKTQNKSIGHYMLLINNLKDEREQLKTQVSILQLRMRIRASDRDQEQLMQGIQHNVLLGYDARNLTDQTDSTETLVLNRVSANEASPQGSNGS